MRKHPVIWVRTRHSKRRRPRLLAVAGPNGSGKSTISQMYVEGGLLPGTYINADDIKVQLATDDLTAARVAEERRERALAAGESFAMETVMSTPEKIDLFRRAKAKGYRVELVFVTTEDPEINVKRVATRYKQGGHNVPPDKIRSRYHRAMELLPAAIAIVDTARIYDNSVTFREIAQKSEDGLVVFASAAGDYWVRWFSEKFGNQVQIVP